MASLFVMYVKIHRSTRCGDTALRNPAIPALSVHAVGFVFHPCGKAKVLRIKQSMSQQVFQVDSVVYISISMMIHISTVTVTMIKICIIQT
jgi:hypothetical protein